MKTMVTNAVRFLIFYKMYINIKKEKTAKQLKCLELKTNQNSSSNKIKLLFDLFFVIRWWIVLLLLNT